MVKPPVLSNRYHYKTKGLIFKPRFSTSSCFFRIFTGFFQALSHL
ncbi:hypothetical protein HOLDEFILI_01712 [Holdemania filiformis DSM 12042]|uniref:Uncharacterized protein n=1 Tax=Holdemania filiformis DSM 12042 TaxID=545696 RepID=B9Y7B6_9FIRM|nr:hypothetical protein HOLDEFILI_01712 [Holdemania filiformis DSM 12042]